MNILVALLIFTLIVVIHELGHFLLAKKNGVGVIEFSVGMGPRIVTYAKNGEKTLLKFFISQKQLEDLEGFEGITKYSVKMLPLGGSCMMVGEDEVSDAEDAFGKKGVWARFWVIFAGPFFNFILAFVLSMLLIGLAGFDAPIVPEVQAGMPMSEAGIQAGDKIISINGEKIDVFREVTAFFQFNPVTEDSVLEIVYERNDEENHAVVRPVQNAEGRWVVGITLRSTYTKASPVEVVKYGLIEVKYWVETTLKTVAQLVTGRVSKDEIAGPVGIVNMVGGVIEESAEYGFLTVFLNILNMCILLSANLGVMNLLPIPALDGGRLVFILIEAVRGKAIDQEKEAMIHMIGLVALMLLMVFVMYNDITRIFR